MSDKPSTSFVKQNSKEKVSRLSQLVKNQLDITIWEKGSSSREKFSAVKYIEEESKIIVSCLSTNLLNSDVLYAFSFNGVSYFGEGRLSSSTSSTFFLNCEKELYKSERRESFRLLTYPHYDVYIQIPFEEDSSIERSNVVSFDTGVSETGLFKNFLQIVGENDTSIKENYARFRVLDISVTGLSFQIGEIEKEYLETKRAIESVYLYFDEEIFISAIEIKYIIPLIRAQGSAYKVGIQFLDVDTTLDERLGGLIARAMRSFENDFEDFLK